MEKELLFEIGTEEIPAGYIPAALQNLKKMIAAHLIELELSFNTIKTTGTPRRLTVCVENLAERQMDKQEKIIGPPKSAAYDKENQPTKAAIGFAKKNNITLNELQIVTTERGEYLMAVVEKIGVDTVDLLADLLPAITKSLPFPKSMKWGSGKVAFARPIQWLLAIYNNSVIPFSINSVTSGNTTRGHRFMAPQDISVTDFDDYLIKLSNSYVIADTTTRRQIVLDSVTEAARQAGGELLPDDELLDIVTHLVEKPYPICGAFEDRFLSLPQEVLITSMREHQKYFAVTDEDGNLKPYFIAVNNTDVRDEKLAAEGHERVIRARLEDALFFFNEDKQNTLADRVKDLDGIIFQRKLGTMLEKTERITRLAGWLSAKLSPELKQETERSALLAKADLLTEMVGEFPSLQGIMGREYARLNNEPADVVSAIYEHYLPLRAGSDLPKNTTGALVSLADRMDTIAGCFGIGEIPSGTADPFGLRRLTIGIIHILMDHEYNLPLDEFITEALTLFGDKLSEGNELAKENIVNFIKIRFSNDLISKGISAETVDAATIAHFNDIVECKRRLDALISISSEETFTLLAGSFKRVNNIIKDNSETAVDENLLQEEAEKELFKSLTTLQDKVNALIDAGRYEEALKEILVMKEPIDLFFDNVMVMADDVAIRQNRLNLLTAISRLFLAIGDFSKMYAMAPAQ